ncbi:MAG: phosphoribosyltransferase family protein [Bacteroidota bacterium]
MPILNDRQIKQKVRRLAYEIIEQNFDAESIYLAGINNNGIAFANRLNAQLRAIDTCPFDVHLLQVRLNPASPLSEDIQIIPSAIDLTDKNVILIDDVANTGRTLYYAFRPFMEMILSKLEVAVLIDRKHKNFPIQVNYVGLTLATTLRDHVKVNLTSDQRDSVEFSA